MNFHFFKKNKRVALASFPRSGNTWLRFMVEQATGEQSGSVYKDRVLPRGSEGIVIKTHKLDSKRYTRAIHLIRNPFDAIDSYFHWKIDIEGNQETNWDKHVEEAVLEWKEHTQHWAAATCQKYFVRYEDIRNNPVPQLKLLFAWLGYELEPKQIEVVLNSSEMSKMRTQGKNYGSRFFRKGQVGKGIENFSNEQKEYVISNLKDLLLNYGYDSVIPNLKS